MQMEKWKTLTEMADLLKVKKSWVYSQTMRTGPGAIPRIKIGSRLRFDPEAVEKWILKRNIDRA
jgi:excisionase family DNA binding protein